MTGALVPEVRIDKNGLPVRRWVRERSLPAVLPAVPPTLRPAMGEEEKLKREFLQSALAHWCTSPSEEMPQVIDRLIDYSAPTIDLMFASLGTTPDKVHFGETVSLLMEFGEERTVREYMALSTAITECEDLRATIAYINGLATYGCFEPDDLSLLDDGEQRLARALLQTTFHLSCVDEVAAEAEKAGEAAVAISDDCNALADRALLAVFLHHPDRAEDLYGFISRAPGNYRRIGDLQDLAGGMHRAVSQGFL